MKILYQIPSLSTIYAGRTIYHGYKNAFIDLGHEFRPLTADDDMEAILNEFQPDILITGLSNYSLRYLDLEVLKRFRQKGLKVAVNIPFWQSPLSKFRVNETPGLKDNLEFVKLVSSGDFGDVFFNICEPGDERMKGFKETTGKSYETIPLAADKIALQDSHSEPRFNADISYIGTNLPDKRAYFQEYVFPLAKKYNLKLYGQDWTKTDQALGWVQRFGQYFNVKPLATIRKPKLQLNDEATIYASSKISINVHETYQKEFGGDCNERTFKIPLCHGFEITDDVACIRKYFIADKEMVIARNKKEWFEKIEHFLKNPEERKPIIEAGRARVLRDHTYHNRATQLIKALA